MQLEKVFRLTSHVTPPVLVGPTPTGVRQFVGSRRTTAVGETLDAEAAPGGGDWITVDGAGWAHPGVRYLLQTHDGAVISLEGTGLMDAEAVGKALQEGLTTDFGEAYLRLSITLQTSDERYAWVNGSLFIGEGRLQAGPSIEYDVYRVR